MWSGVHSCRTLLLRLSPHHLDDTSGGILASRLVTLCRRSRPRRRRGLTHLVADFFMKFVLMMCHQLWHYVLCLWTMNFACATRISYGTVTLAVIIMCEIFVLWHAIVFLLCVRLCFGYVRLAHDWLNNSGHCSSHARQSGVTGVNNSGYCSSRARQSGVTGVGRRSHARGCTSTGDAGLVVPHRMA
jgi:hypothetical protein